MVTIRLARYGKRKHPTYRVVVSDKRKDTVGPYLEQLGTYDPHAAPGTGTNLNVERVKHWLSVGATASPSAHNLLVAAKLIEGASVPLGAAKKAVAEGDAKPAEKPIAEAKATEATPAPTEAKTEAAPAA